MIRGLLIPWDSSRKHREERELPVKGPHVPHQTWVLGQLYCFVVHPRKTILEQKIRVNGMRKLRSISVGALACGKAVGESGV